MKLSRRLDGWLFALLLLAGAGALGFFSARYAHVSDWTANGRLSLSPQSRAVLAKLDGPVEIVSYASPQGDLRAQVAGFLQRYQQAKPDIALRFVDPQQDPARMRELGIAVDGELILHYRGHEQRLTELSESDVTNALQRLIRGNDRIVAFVTGDGERLPSGEGGADMTALMDQLAQSGLRAVPLSFAQAAAVPQGTDLVVLASPTSDLPAGATQALVNYLQDGGNLLWLRDPANDDLGLKPLAAALGVQVLPGVLVDGGGAALGLADPRVLAVAQYPPNPVTLGLQLATRFPQVAALARTGADGWTATPLLRSSAQSWTEFHPIDNAHPSAIHYDTAAGEFKGPLDFGFTLARLSPSPDKREQRAVVVGDGDFLSNAYLGQGGNRALGERIFNWLLGDDALVDLPREGVPDRLLRISQNELDAASVGFMVLLPLLLLAIGGLIAWRRRLA
ncbi:GldG family protein [Rhodanobacter sp. DHG33]|uniref:GldG family protein n=1 Tax=Rhodanobacter sp. DHG33 TaxID=2775921 RepID=UPI00177E9D05|nr:GldG family protein [Rhodanobacter sp. DHG33]MBD8899557.1 GldG family protein [Rhodanobacter sp. DHG33]